MAQNTPNPNRQYRATVFEMVFSRKRECLELYNAVNGSHYTDPEDIKINTLDNALYMERYNDVSFIIDSRMSLYEHQSTKNPNLPLRFLIYVANLYSGIVGNTKIYSETMVLIPTPHFIIFYNGDKNMPEKKELKLSDAFKVAEDQPSLELKATLLNINRGYNDKLKAECRTLADYAEFTARVNENSKLMKIEKAMELAIDSCIRDDIMADFLKKNRNEVSRLGIFEYDFNEHMQLVREEGRAQGRAQGLEQGRAQGQINNLSQNIKSLMKNMGMSADEAMNTLEVTESDREAVRPLL